MRPGADLDGLVEAVAVAADRARDADGDRGRLRASQPAPIGASVAPGRLALALAQRRRRGGGPLAVVSCDNLHANGSVLREAHAGAGRSARPRPAAAGSSARSRSSAPRSIGSRRATTDEDRAPGGARARTARRGARRHRAVHRLGAVRRVPGAAGPHWEVAGARFVADIEPWELRKLWLLNGGHSLLAYLGLLRGHQTVADAIADARAGAMRSSDFWDLAQRHLPAGELDLAGVPPPAARALRQRAGSATRSRRSPVTGWTSSAIASCR